MRDVALQCVAVDQLHRARAVPHLDVSPGLIPKQPHGQVRKVREIHCGDLRLPEKPLYRSKM